jgi:hypothetical protein
MGKWDVNDQDQEDFDQEKQIREWLEREGNTGTVEFKHINSKGRARNTLLKGSISLDQEITDDGAGTFADIIAGSDGRDLECGPCIDEPEREPQEKIYGYLSALGFNQGDLEWLIKMLKLSNQENKRHSEKSPIDSEW